MKYFVIFCSIFFTHNLYATGGFECSTPNGDVIIYAMTARMFGSPISGDVTVIQNGITQRVAKERVVGYWNLGSEFKIMVLDEGFNNIFLKIMANRRGQDSMVSGSVSIDGVDQGLIDCFFE